MSAEKTISITRHPTMVEARYNPPFRAVDPFRLIPSSPGMYLSHLSLAGEGIITGVVMSTGPDERLQASAATALVYAAQNVDRRYKLVVPKDDASPEDNVMKVGLVQNRTKLALVFDNPVVRQEIAGQVEDRFESVRYIPEDTPEVRAALVDRSELPQAREECLTVLHGLATALNHRLDVQRRHAA